MKSKNNSSKIKGQIQTIGKGSPKKIVSNMNNMKQEEKANRLIGSLCLTKLVENCPIVLQEQYMKFIWDNIITFIETKNYTAKYELLNCLISLILGAEGLFAPFANATLYKVLDFLTEDDWNKRKLALNVIQELKSQQQLTEQENKRREENQQKIIAELNSQREKIEQENKIREENQIKVIQELKEQQLINDEENKKREENQLKVIQELKSQQQLTEQENKRREENQRLMIKKEEIKNKK